MSRDTALVITSISPPNAALKQYAEGCQSNGFNFIVIGDEKSPSDFYLPECDFWSLERQKSMKFSLAGMVPVRHYARKNLGYLEAIRQGAKVLIETDDDNFPRPSFWVERSAHVTADRCDGRGWVNVYRYFNESDVWPRGFPLEHVQCITPPLVTLTEERCFCPIQQGLADENPDVDAVYRLTKTLPIRFSPAPRIALARDVWCPFNSQNTTWFSAAFPLLYLPSYCSFRMCDIWRSFVAMRICWDNDWSVLYHGPTVWQERNAHNLLQDFADEISGYLNNSRICQKFESLDIKPGAGQMASNLGTCYHALVDLGLVPQEELRLVDAWLNDLEHLSRCR
jgi:hypothetical protein